MENKMQQAADFAGGQSALARSLGVSPQAVQRWCDIGKPPAERVLDIEKFIEAKVTRHELRPDLYPIEQPT